MRSIKVFNNVSIDGFFTDPHGDLSWAHRGMDDAEWVKFIAGNAKGKAEFLFGRITYEMMASYWPTPIALENDPIVAEAMNSQTKYVFSRTLKKLSWQNSQLMQGDLPSAIKQLKKSKGPDIMIFGSGEIIHQLTEESLIDEYQLILVPTVLGGGRTMFGELQSKMDLKLMDSRSFKNGNVFLRYKKST